MSITPEELRERAATLGGALEQLRGPEMEATRPERAYVDGAKATLAALADELEGEGDTQGHP